MTRGPNPHAVLGASGSDTARAKLRTWDAAVRAEASNARNLFAPEAEGPVYVETALRVILGFRLARPSGHWGKNGLNATGRRTPYPIVKPDIDKLTRATLDSMIGTIYDDDSRICEKIVTKTYADPGDEGATITVEPVDYKPPPATESGPVLPGLVE